MAQVNLSHMLYHGGQKKTEVPVCVVIGILLSDVPSLLDIVQDRISHFVSTGREVYAMCADLYEVFCATPRVSCPFAASGVEISMDAERTFPVSTTEGEASILPLKLVHSR